MSKTKAPLQEELDANFGYVYNVVGPGNRVYVGKHVHVKGEPWEFYTGSDLRLRDEQCMLEPAAFEQRTNELDRMHRKPGTRLRFYSKYLTGYAHDADSLAAMELRSIEALVRSGTPFYNMADAAQFATSYEARLSMLAFRLSFEPRELKSLPDEISRLIQAHHPLSFGSFDLHYEAIAEAIHIRAQRFNFRRRPQRGLHF